MKPTFPWITSFHTPHTQPTNNNSQRFPKNATTGTLSQNVRGFRQDTQRLWMAGWKQLLEGRQVHTILLQETHVTSHEEAHELTTLWTRMWGRHTDAERPLAFWSITDRSAAGVGILIHPDNPEHWTPLDLDIPPGRVLAIQSPSRTIVNVYAPNLRTDRERLFSHLMVQLPQQGKRLLVMGDFNCVLEPAHDRITDGKWSTGPSESPALTRLLHHHELHDTATDLTHPISSATARDRLTYWQQQHGARLDRGYVNPSERQWTAAANTITPHAETDHKGYIVWSRDPDLQPNTHPIHPLLYPIRGRHPEEIDAAVTQAVQTTMASATANDLDWETTRQMLSRSLQVIKRTEQRRARRAVKKSERRRRRQLRTLQDLIDYERQRIDADCNAVAERDSPSQPATTAHCTSASGRENGR